MFIMQLESCGLFKSLPCIVFFFLITPTPAAIVFLRDDLLRQDLVSLWKGIKLSQLAKVPSPFVGKNGCDMLHGLARCPPGCWFASLESHQCCGARRRWRHSRLFLSHRFALFLWLSDNKGSRDGGRSVIKWAIFRGGCWCYAHAAVVGASIQENTAR